MTESSYKIIERVRAKRESKLSSALIRSAALGIAVKGETTPWLAERLTYDQLEQAHFIADEHRLHLDALRRDNTEKHGTASEDLVVYNDVDTDGIESAA